MKKLMRLFKLACLVLDLKCDFIGTVSVAAATAVAGYDLFQNQKWNITGKPRTLKGIRVAGSTAAYDCSFNLYIGDSHIGEFFNLAAGAPLVDHFLPLNKYVPPGSRIAAVMVTAPTANPINVILD